MTIRPPSDETLLAYATGRLREGPALVVETHLALCQESRAWVERLSTIGGMLLESLPEVDIGRDALDRVLARIDAGEDPEIRFPSDEPGLPEPLSRYDVGPWKWAGRGTLVRKVLVPEDGACRVIMFKIDPGRKMPQHTHSGIEFTCVISGSYSDESGRFGPGDFEEADETTSHRPVVDSDVPCICIVALDGKVKLEGVIGRLLQPFVRI